MINQIIIRTNGNTTLPNGFALSISNDIFGFENHAFRNLYKSVETSKTIAAIIRYKKISYSIVKDYHTMVIKLETY